MKRFIPLLLIFGVALLTMAQFSSADRAANVVSGQEALTAGAESVALQDQGKQAGEGAANSDRKSEDLKNPMTRALYELLGQAEDIEEADRQEAADSIFFADKALTTYKKNYKSAIEAWNAQVKHEIELGRIAYRKPGVPELTEEERRWMERCCVRRCCCDQDGDGKIDEDCCDKDGDGKLDKDCCCDKDGDGKIDEDCCDADGDGKLDTDCCCGNHEQHKQDAAKTDAMRGRLLDVLKKKVELSAHLTPEKRAAALESIRKAEAILSQGASTAAEKPGP